jgi:hypothetical protein
MKSIWVLVAVVMFVVPSAQSAADKADMNGYWWENSTPSF